MPAGRPPLERRAEIRLQARCHEIDDLRWRADAARAGKSYSEWIRYCLNEMGGRNTKPRPVTQAREAEVTPATPAREPEVIEEHPGIVRSTRLDSSPGFARLREQARDLATSSGKCTADVARGTRCKLCGKIH